MIRRTMSGGLLVLAVSVNVAAAQAARADSAPSPEPLFTSGDGWLAAGFGVAILALAPHDEKIALWSQSASVQTQAHTNLANTFNWIGGSGVLIFSVAGYGAGWITGSRPVAEIGLRATEAIIVSGAITGLLKGAFGRQRPYVNINDPDYFVFGKGFTSAGYTSMPSGHTTAAFAFAVSVTDEVHRYWPEETWWVATLTYGSAAMVGLARIYSNKHWSTDVAAGALVGTFSALGVNRWHRAHPNSKFDRWLLPKGVTPTKGGAALTWSYAF